MSRVGYYRYKTTITNEPRSIQFVVNGVLAGQKPVQPVAFCDGDGDRILKYLDTKGQYRFYPFNKYYEVNDSPKLIGKTNEFIASILTDQTNSKNIGYKNERRMLLTADVTAEELTILSDIYASPRVYLYVGDGVSDIAKDWLEVSITGDNTVRRRKAKSGRVDITVLLPEHFTIKMV